MERCCWGSLSRRTPGNLILLTLIYPEIFLLLFAAAPPLIITSFGMCCSEINPFQDREEKGRKQWLLKRFNDQCCCCLLNRAITLLYIYSGCAINIKETGSRRKNKKKNVIVIWSLMLFGNDDDVAPPILL